MTAENKEPLIIIISGKARAGKTTSANMINEINNNKKVIDLAYGNYIKEYAKKISNWKGDEADKPRELLQQLGTNIIRKELGDEFFINKMIEDIQVYSYFFDIITISDARFPKELDLIKKKFKNVVKINIIRPNFDNGLTIEQKKHLSETALDNYFDYNYVIINDKTLDDLKDKIKNILKEEI